MAGFFIRRRAAKAGQGLAGLLTGLAGSDKKLFKSITYVHT
jgi:hypothetical protein